jgi:hypothetical protein
MLTPFWAVMSSQEGPVINLCSPLTAQYSTPSGAPASLQVESDYPRAGGVRITINHEKEEHYTISVRIPEWSAHTDLLVNGSKLPVYPGTYARISRVWKPGSNIRIRFDMRGRLVSAPDNNGQLAVTRGPLVLSVDDRLIDVSKKGTATLITNEFPFIAIKEKKSPVSGIWMAFEVPCILDGRKAILPLCDFASAGSGWSETNRYRTWLPQPLDLAVVFDSGQSWQLLTHRPYRPAADGKPPKKK